MNVTSETIEITDICSVDKSGEFKRVYLSQSIIIHSTLKEQYRELIRKACELRYVFFYFNHI